MSLIWKVLKSFLKCLHRERTALIMTTFSEVHWTTQLWRRIQLLCTLYTKGPKQTPGWWWRYEWAFTNSLKVFLRSHKQLSYSVKNILCFYVLFTLVELLPLTRNIMEVPGRGTPKCVSAEEFSSDCFICFGIFYCCDLRMWLDSFLQVIATQPHRVILSFFIPLGENNRKCFSI